MKQNLSIALSLSSPFSLPPLLFKLSYLPNVPEILTKDQTWKKTQKYMRKSRCANKSSDRYIWCYSL